MPVTARLVKEMALQCGFELAGIAPAAPLDEHAWYREWAAGGMAGEMGYLTDRRGDMRRDPRSLLSSARSVLCVGKLYNAPKPYSVDFEAAELGWISRYAWGEDYHRVLADGLNRVVDRLTSNGAGPFEWKVCVDTAPLLERALARRAGLGWIAKNTCLIREGMGSWFFLGELLLSLDLEYDAPPPDRCGSCTRCIDACPTRAIVPTGRPEPAWAVDSRLCISYLTIELRGLWSEELRAPAGNNVFGCDICQDVCPWNRTVPVTPDPAFEPANVAPPLDRMAALTEEEFVAMFRGTPVVRAKYAGFLRNVAVAMGNSGCREFRGPLERLARHSDQAVAEHARWALAQIGRIK
jgi:epoxyqueuosine reductase